MRREGTEPTRLAPLDGVRAVAVVVVMGYHAGIPGLRVGGFYGQDAFFVLSGLLITSLLLREGAATSRIDLIAFWGRRLRRLLPGLAVMLLAVAVYVRWWAPAGTYASVTGDAFAALFYVSNWHLIASSSDYFTATGAPSLLTHTWSLAVEEQFYLGWPLVVLVVLLVGRRVGRPLFAPLAVGALSSVGALASAAWMAHLYADGASTSRLYYGADTHAQCLLVGAALAAALAVAGRRRPTRDLFPAARTAAARGAWVVVGLAGAVGLALIWTRVGSATPFAFRGGFLAVAGCTAAVLVSVVTVPRGPLGRALGIRPLTWLGEVSYGVYLWYFPVFAVADGARLGLHSWPLFAVRVAVTVAIAAVSYYAVERPLRTGRALRLDAAAWAGRLRPVSTGAVALVVVSAFLLVTDPTRQSRAAAPAVALAPITRQRPAGPPTRVLLAGDSLAITLGASLGAADLSTAYGYTLDDAGLFGCGLAVSTELHLHGQPWNPAPECSTATPASRQWPALLARRVRSTRPKVLLYVAARWDVLDRQDADGTWTNVTQPAGAAYLRAQMERVVDIAAAGGAKVVLATAPCLSTGERPDGRPWPEDGATRVDAYNDDVRAVAAAHPGKVSVLDLHALVCPKGTFQQRLGDLTVRASDGIHYPFFSIDHPDAADPDTVDEVRRFGAWLAPQLVPLLAGTAGGG